jgi:hypothetical protein
MTNNEVTLEHWEQRGLQRLDEHDRVQFMAALEFIQLLVGAKLRSIADVGSGPGHQAFVLRELGMEPTCIDYLKPKYGPTVATSERDGRVGVRRGVVASLS